MIRANEEESRMVNQSSLMKGFLAVATFCLGVTVVVVGKPILSPVT